MVALARVVRPHGRKGEVAAEILTDFPERLPALRDVWLCAPDGSLKPAKLLSVRMQRGQAIIHFEGCSSISDAELLRGHELHIKLADRVSLAAGRYFITDLIGCEICESGSSAPLGRVRDVQLTGEGASGTPLLVVERPSLGGRRERELLIPFAAEICTSIELQARRIEVSLPEGLLDLT